MTRVYISAPFRGYSTEMQGREYGVLDDENHRRFLEHVEGAIKGLGFEVCLPHRDEGKWGSIYIEPDRITGICFDLIGASDILVVFPGKSRGVHIEIGYAAALGKRLIVFLSEHEKESTLLRGISCATEVKVLRYGSLKDIEALLREELTNQPIAESSLRPGEEGQNAG